MQLRPFQKNAIQILSKKQAHLICIAPTGAGKSLIYEYFSMDKRERVLLITPLVALAQQQKLKLEEAGLRVSFGLGEFLHASEGTDTWILSPEALLFPETCRSILRFRPELLVVDECHCLLEWGDGFRPSFKQIPNLINAAKIPRSLWLSATLPKEDLQSIRDLLPKKTQVIGEFGLPPQLEIGFFKVSQDLRPSQLCRFLEFNLSPGIIFCTTRSEVERISRLIQGMGRKALPYHAGMSREERSYQEAQIRREEGIVVATSAFGMGVHYPHLEWVLCYRPPASPLALAQALGRAGRSSLRARAWIFWDEDDFRLIEWMALHSERRKQALRSVASILRSAQCRRQALHSYFQPEGPLPPRCQTCDSCAALSY